MYFSVASMLLMTTVEEKNLIWNGDAYAKVIVIIIIIMQQFLYNYNVAMSCKVPLKSSILCNFCTSVKLDVVTPATEENVAFRGVLHLEERHHQLAVKAVLQISF